MPGVTEIAEAAPSGQPKVTGAGHAQLRLGRDHPVSPCRFYLGGNCMRAQRTPPVLDVAGLQNLTVVLDRLRDSLRQISELKVRESLAKEPVVHHFLGGPVLV